jgi:hypothetical protein
MREKGALGIDYVWNKGRKVLRNIVESYFPVWCCLIIIEIEM